mmetsp:Transcript_26464/g.54173  ORF Transcript_26464/g.54173 Transcript_26464/m.54173 type:complete len:289 (+) Transcript_26464:1092-1958(+)
MREKISRLIMMASIMTERPGAVSTMSAAAAAVSVAPWTAIPTSARLRAGASLTPSPVMPTTHPRWRRASMMRNLCSGNTCAKPDTFSIISPYSAPSVLGMALVVSTMGSASAFKMSVPMPSWRAVSLAMAPWSPVIIFTATPYMPARRIVSLVSGRGGSKKVKSPIRFMASPLYCTATASARIPRCANSSTSVSNFSPMLDLLSLRPRITCGAPLVTTNSRPSGPLRVDSVRLVAGSNGTYSSCSNESSGALSTASSTKVSRASLAGSFHLAASAANCRILGWSMPGW